jgi:hypothetical protein
LSDFYESPSATWFTIYLFFAATFIVASNLFLIALTLISPLLRNNSANWFLLGLSLSDLIHYSGFVVGSYAIWFKDRHVCSVSGTFVIITGTASFGFPALIAANRYYAICTLPANNGVFSLGRTIFSKRMTVPLIFGWYGCAFLINLPLILNQAYGEDPVGFCGAIKFTSVGIMMFYLLAASIFPLSLLTTALYYYRLAKWLKQHQTNSTLQVN